MRRSALLVCSLVLAACSSSDPAPPPPPVCPTGTVLQGSDCVGIVCGAGYALQGNDCVDVDECATPVVAFEKTNYGAEQDCITPEVCITRGERYPIYNSVVDPYERVDCDAAVPTGTLWALGTCEQVVEEDFGPFLSDSFSACEPPTIVDAPACLRVGDRYFDVEFDSWTSQEYGGRFSYERREAICGIGLVCVNTPGSYACSCPAGFALQDGGCVDVDECAAGTHGCEASAACENVAGSYRCSCGELTFTKADFGDEQDCLTPEVCLTRADRYPLYNSVSDPEPTDNYPCGSTLPTGTRWALGTCDSAGPSRFGAFLSGKFSDCAPTSVVGVPACLEIGSSRFDLTFTSWTSGQSGGGGGFSYVRSANVAPGVACE